MEKSYEMVYEEHTSDEFELVISILESYAHDIRKVLNSPYVKLSNEDRIKEAKRLLKEFKENKMTSWFEEGTITYIVEELEKEIMDYEQRTDNQR